MDIEKIKKKIIDESPRQLYHELRAKFLKPQSNPVFTAEFPAVFVLSTGRTGTETLDALFNLAQNIFTYHEPAPILYRLSKLAYRYENEPLVKELLCESFFTARMNLLKYSLDCGRGYVETSPQVTFLAPLILSVIPQAHFIYLVRDPGSVIRSGMRRKWFDGHPSDSARITPKPGSPEATAWDHYSPFQKNIWLWNETNRWIMEFTSSIPPEKVLTIHSEDVFSMDQKTLQALYGFIGARMPRPQKIACLLQKKMNAQKTGEFPTSAYWSAAQKTELINMASETAKKLGYDLSKDHE